VNLLKRVLIEKRFVVTLVLIVIVINIGLHSLVIYPWSIKVANAEERTTRALANLGVAAETLDAAQTKMKAKREADAELQRFYNDVLPQNLSGAREITYVHLAELASKTHLRMERRSTTPGQEADSRLASLQTTMLLQGEYTDIRRFIYELETSPEFILIENVVLNQGTSTDSALVLTLGLSTYYLGGDHEELNQSL